MTDFSYNDFLNWLNSQPESSFTEIKEQINPTTFRHQIAKPDGSLLTFAEFLGLLKNKDRNFIKEFRMLGLGGGYTYFWECIPVSKATINKPFEFVKTKNEALDRMTQDWSRFQEHIDRSDNPEVTSFPNLSGDSILVIPMPKRGHRISCTERDNEIRDYKHLRKFLVEADLEQWDSFWQEVGKKMLESLEENDAPKWLSTHGLGVPYLHVRIDSRPKYYSWNEYKEEIIEEPEEPTTPTTPSTPTEPTEQTKRKNEEVDSSSEDELNKKRKVSEEENHEVSREVGEEIKESPSSSSPTASGGSTFKEKEDKSNKDLKKLQEGKRTNASRNLLSLHPKKGNFVKDAKKWFDELINSASENDYQFLKEVCGEISDDRKQKIVAKLEEIKSSINSKKDFKNNNFFKEEEGEIEARQFLQKVNENVSLKEQTDEALDKAQEILNNPQASSEELRAALQRIVDCSGKNTKKEGKLNEQIEQMNVDPETSKRIQQVVNQLRQRLQVIETEKIQTGNISTYNKEKVPSAIWITAGIFGVGALGTLVYWTIKKRAKGSK